MTAGRASRIAALAFLELTVAHLVPHMFLVGLVEEGDQLRPGPVGCFVLVVHQVGDRRRRQVRHDLLEQAEGRVDLGRRHFSPALPVLDQRVENVAVLYFNPVLV